MGKTRLCKRDPETSIQAWYCTSRWQQSQRPFFQRFLEGRFDLDFWIPWWIRRCQLDDPWFPSMEDGFSKETPGSESHHLDLWQFFSQGWSGSFFCRNWWSCSDSDSTGIIIWTWHFLLTFGELRYFCLGPISEPFIWHIFCCFSWLSDFRSPKNSEIWNLLKLLPSEIAGVCSARSEVVCHCDKPGLPKPPTCKAGRGAVRHGRHGRHGPLFQRGDDEVHLRPGGWGHSWGKWQSNFQVEVSGVYPSGKLT